LRVGQTGAESRPFFFSVVKTAAVFSFYIASRDNILFGLKDNNGERKMPVHKPAFRPTTSR